MPKKSKALLPDGADWKRLLAGLHDWSPTEYIRIGIPALDLVLGQGIPRGRMMEVVGEPATAKSAFALTAAAAFQRSGGIAIYLDSEQKTDRDFAIRLGVDWGKIRYYQVESIEELQKILGRTAKTAPPGLPVVVIVDSLAGTPGADELGDLLSEGGAKATEGLARARKFSTTFRTALHALSKRNVTLLCVNQLRVKINMFGPSGTEPPGGKAPKFHSTIRLMFRAKEKIASMRNRDVIVGQMIEVETLKNTCAPPFRKAKLVFKFDSGFEPYSGFKEFLLRYGRISEEGNVLVYKGRKFRGAELPAIIAEMPELLAPLNGTIETPAPKETREVFMDTLKRIENGEA